MAVAKNKSVLNTNTEKKTKDDKAYEALQNKIQTMEKEHKEELAEIKSLLKLNNTSLKVDNDVVVQTSELANVLKELKKQGTQDDKEKDFVKRGIIHNQAQAINHRKEQKQMEYEYKKLAKQQVYAEALARTGGNKLISRKEAEKVHPELVRFKYNSGQSDYAPVQTYVGDITGTKYNFERNNWNYIYDEDYDNIETRVNGSTTIDPIVSSLNRISGLQTKGFQGQDSEGAKSFEVGGVDLNSPQAQDVLTNMFSNDDKGGK